MLSLNIGMMYMVYKADGTVVLLAVLSKDEDVVNRILYHLDQTLDTYGYGGEYSKVVATVKQIMELISVDVTGFYSICRALHLKYNPDKQYRIPDIPRCNSEYHGALEY